MSFYQSLESKLLIEMWQRTGMTEEERTQSNQVPPEFGWIKPGVKCLHKNWAGVKTISLLPYRNSAWGWCTQIEERGIFQLCEDLMPLPNTETITLTLTRHQAQALLLQMQKLDGVSRGFIEDERFYREIESMIEEQLK